MSIFKCSKCGMVENTALSHYWWNVTQEGQKPLCSLCDPEIEKWHGAFERVTPESCGYVEGPDGFLYMPDDEYLARLKKEAETRKEKP